jgi:hypothetical protein
MDAAAWSLARERAALNRTRLAALCLCLALCVAAGWLGWREARLTALPEVTKAELAVQGVNDTRLRLKQLSLALYLAKVNRNALLSDVLGITGTEELCISQDDLRRLPADSPCSVSLRSAMETVWALSYRGDGLRPDATLLRDFWGSSMMLNLSEQSCGHYGAWCPEDTIGSAGPDGKPNTPDDIREAVPQHLGPAAAAKAAQ